MIPRQPGPDQFVVGAAVRKMVKGEMHCISVAVNGPPEWWNRVQYPRCCLSDLADYTLYANNDPLRYS